MGNVTSILMMVDTPGVTLDTPGAKPHRPNRIYIEVSSR